MDALLGWYSMADVSTVTWQQESTGFFVTCVFVGALGSSQVQTHADYLM